MNGWRVFASVKLIDVVDPLVDGPSVLLSVLDPLHQRLPGRASAPQVAAQLQVQHGWVGLIGAGLVEDGQPYFILDSVGSRYLYEGVYVAHCGDEIGDEGYQLVVQLDLLWSVPVGTQDPLDFLFCYSSLLYWSLPREILIVSCETEKYNEEVALPVVRDN